MDSFEIKINIENKGSKPILKGTIIPLGYHFESFGSIAYNYPKHNEEYILENDLMPGNKVQYIFSNKILLKENLYRIDLVIYSTLIDQYPFDNSVNIPYRKLDFKKDLSLSIGFDNSNKCNVDKFKIRVFIRNNGCIKIPKGTILKVRISQPISKTYKFTLSSDLNPGQLIAKNHTLDLNLNKSFKLKANLIFNDDKYENNHFENSIKVLKTITGSYEEDFSKYYDFENPNFKYFNPKRNSGAIFKLYETQKDTVLSFYGTHRYDKNGLVLNLDCNNMKGIFNENKSYYSIPLELCVDMEKFSSPKLSFNMKQNSIYDNNVEVHDSLRPICKISFPDRYQIPPKYIYNIKDNKTKNFQVDIPESYKGKVLLEMFTIYGELDEHYKIKYDESDYIFIDDIKITGIGLDKKGQVILAFPNPSNDRILFKRVGNKNKKLLIINIFDSIGRIVDKLKLIDKSISWNLNHIPKGMYYFTIISNGDLVDNGRVVVIH